MNLNSTFKKMSEVLDISFDSLCKEISHKVKSGEARENALKKIFSQYLPKRVGISTGFVIDASPKESKQIDIIVYDRYNASIFDINGIKYFPCETVLAVGEVKAEIDSEEDLQDALAKIRSVKELDRSNQGRNKMVTGPGLSFDIFKEKFDPLTWHKDQILGFIFTRVSMKKQYVIEALQKYYSQVERRYWPNIFCAYKDYLISFETKKGLSPSAMEAESMYCTAETEAPNLLLIFLSKLSTFLAEAHVARPDYFHYFQINSTQHGDHPLTTSS